MTYLYTHGRKKINLFQKLCYLHILVVTYPRNFHNKYKVRLFLRLAYLWEKMGENGKERGKICENIMGGNNERTGQIWVCPVLIPLYTFFV